MDFDELRLFQYLARTLHFGVTSRECHVSPSTLTRTIQRLEEEVAVPLFTRSKRRVELTDGGRTLARYAAKALAEFDTLRASLRQAGPRLEGRLRVFTTVTASYTILPSILGRFRAAHPGVRIELETGYPVDALEQLQRGRIDVAVASVPDRLPRPVLGKTVVRTPLRFVAPTLPCEVSALLESDARLPWAELPYILPHAGATRAHADRWFRRSRVTPRLYSEVAGSEAIMSLVALGCGVGIVPELVRDRSPLRSRVRVLTPSRELAELRVAVCAMRARVGQPTLHAFWSEVEGATR